MRKTTVYLNDDEAEALRQLAAATGTSPCYARELGFDNHWKPHVLADGNGDETARYAGIVAAAIGCFCLVLRARIGSCLGARPVIMSVAVPVETSTWGKIVFSSRSARSQSVAGGNGDGDRSR